jgi:hypothetical protein
MGTFLINFLLGACRHGHQSRPFTLDNQTYKVSGGKELREPNNVSPVRTVRSDSHSHGHFKDSISNRALREEIPAQAITLRG